MKKFLSLILAATMIFGMTTFTSFAATTNTANYKVNVDVNSNSTGNELVPGLTYRFDLETAKGYAVDADFMKDYSLSVEIKNEDGKRYLEYARIVRGSDGDYQLMVRARGRRDDVVDADIYIISKPKRGTSKTEVYSDLLTLEINSVYEEIYDDVIDADEYSPLVQFDKDIREVEISFANGFVYYEGKISSSKRKFNLAYNTDEVYSIVDKNPSAYLNFIEFAGEPSFSSPGYLYFNTEDTYLYEITENGLVKLNTTKSNDIMKYRTSTLTKYVTSDRPLRNATNSSNDDSSSSSSSSSSTVVTPSKPTVSDSGKLTLTTSTINNAKREGSYAVVNISSDSLYTSGTELYYAGNVLKNNEKLIIRRIKDSKIPYQWYVDAKNASKASAKLELGVTQNKESTKKFFEKWFSNKVSVIGLQHSGEMGTTMSLAVKQDLTGLNQNSLRAYLYNPKTNKYKVMTNANIYVDRAGFIHLTVSEGGDIVITDRALASR